MLLFAVGALRGLKVDPKEGVRVMLDWFAPSVALRLFDVLTDLLEDLTLPHGEVPGIARGRSIYTVDICNFLLKKVPV